MDRVKPRADTETEQTNGQQTLLQFLEIYFAVEIVCSLELLLILDNLPVPHQIIPIKKLLMN